MRKGLVRYIWIHPYMHTACQTVMLAFFPLHMTSTSQGATDASALRQQAHYSCVSKLCEPRKMQLKWVAQRDGLLKSCALPSSALRGVDIKLA